MPGPVSDSLDPEWGTAYNGYLIERALRELHSKLTHEVFHDRKPMYILDVVNAMNMDKEVTAKLTEREWRLLRFSLERAWENL